MGNGIVPCVLGGVIFNVEVRKLARQRIVNIVYIVDIVGIVDIA